MKLRTSAVILAGVAAIALAGVTANGQIARNASLATQVSPAKKAENFRLVDSTSKSHELFYYKDAPGIVIVAYAPGSSFIHEAAPALARIKSDYAAKGVRVFLLSASAADRAAVNADITKAGLDIPVLLDTSQLISESLGVSQVAQAFVIDPKSWSVVYSGPIDNRFAGKSPNAKATVKAAYVADALDSLIAGSPVKTASAKLESPGIAFPQRARAAEFANISYSKDVAPILAKNCASCHTEGGIGPFPMNGYDKVKGFAPMIREAIRTDRMPPYNADPHLGQFKGDMNLSDKDAQTLVHWIEAGAPRGEGADPLTTAVKPAPEWELGQPDLILTLPAYKVPASGVVDYQNPTVKNPLTEGRWLRAATVKPSDRRAVHHLLSPVGGYAVGAETTKYAEGTGVWVQPGQKLRFQMHYTPYGKETTDTTRVGIYFYPKDAPPKIVRRSAVIANAAIEIPPGAARHEETAYISFPEDATLYTIFPHAHYRGENAAFFLKKPGEKEVEILALPKYDFNWQRGYEFATPINVPAGSKLITRYQYDNSAANPANPDPTITVKWGEQSWEEMQYTAVGFRWNAETVEDQKPEFMTRMNASRTIGIMDVNFDDKVEKSEVRGRMAQMILPNFDRMDTNKDGALSGAEMAQINSVMNRRIEEAQAQQSVGQ
jgi:peroxiredoxin/mono/diheme cytochrome c family protein